MANATRARKQSAKRVIKSGAGALRFLASAQQAYIEAVINNGELMFDLAAQLNEANDALRKARDSAIAKAKESDMDLGESEDEAA